MFTRRFTALLTVLLLTSVTAQTTLAAPLIYVLSESSESTGNDPGVISYIDTRNSDLIGQSKTDVAGAQTAVASPDQSKLYVTDRHDGLVYVLETFSNDLIATIPVVNDGEIVVSSDGATAYVGDASNGQIRVLDLTDNTYTTSINTGNSPFYLTLAPDGNTLYATLFGSIVVIDTKTNSVQSTITVGSFLQDIVVTPDGNTIYVADLTDNTVKAVNIATSTVVDTISVGSDPVGLAITPDGTKLYVANQSDNNVSVIATATNTVTSTIKLATDAGPSLLVASLDGTRIFVLNSFFDSDERTAVAVLDTTTDTLLRTIPVPNAFFSFGIGLVDRGFTKTGDNITVSPIPNVTLTFDSITGTGDTNADSIAVSPTPSGFKLNDDSLAFDITSTTTFSGNVEICVNYTSDKDEDSLQILHEEDGKFINVTSSLDTINNIICGSVTSLSRFLIAIPLPFGLSEQLFTRTIEKPVSESVLFTSAAGSATLNISTGLLTETDAPAVSSADIFLNGTLIASPSDFSAQPLMVPVTLLDGYNELTVILRGKPGSMLSITIQ